MYGVTIGGLGLAACLFTALEAMRTRRVLGAVTLERMERVFDVMEGAFHLAYTHLNRFEHS